MMYRSVCVPAALLALLTLTLVVSRSQSCPRSCNCYQANEVHCTFRSLLSIPPGLPAHTKRINLGFNSISRLQDRSLAGLKKVELLMLHSNDLHHLPDGVFRDMKSLQILKLSYNKLREISSSLTFSGLTSLLRLYLDHNLLQHIHPRALLQLPSLRLLRLQGNKLHQLHPHALCTLSLLNTYYFSTLRHLDLSNNSLTILPKDSVATAPLLESLAMQENPWSCDCRMNWFFTWSLAHRGVVKCTTGTQCPVCATPTALQGEGLLDQTALPCSPPFIHSAGKKEKPQETDLNEIPTVDAFRQPLGSVSLGLFDQQGNRVDLTCNITHSTDSQHITPPPDLSQTSSSPLPLALSLCLECPMEEQSYEKLWRILAYYSETAAHLEREIMLSKAPALAYRYRQSAETDGYYHTAVKASVRARPHWLLQPAISIQLNRAQSNRYKVQLMYLTRVSAHPDPTSQLSPSSPSPHPWVLIATNHSTTALTAVAGSKVALSCPLLSSDNPKVQWILPDGSKLISPSRSLDRRLQASALGLLLQKVQLSDAGIYYCVAWAGRDTDVLPMRLAVEESPVPHSGELIGPPVIGTVGEAVTLSCKISGSPQPSLSWILPDRTIVRRGVAVSGGLKIQLNGSLSLSNPSLRDTGHYRCVGVNQYGSDSLSMHLKLGLQHITPHKTSFPRRPQSAAGRSTKIRAPLFHQLDEGSGNEEEQEEQRTPVGSRRNSIPRQPHLDRMHPVGTVQQHGSVRGGPPRRGGGPSTEQRRVRFQNRHRVSTNRQRIDPQKWADLLAKIRQKTANISNSQPMPTGNPTARPTQGTKDKETRGHEEGNTNRGHAQGPRVDVEAEGSLVDDVALQEEHTQPIQSGHADTEATEIKTDVEAENSTEWSIVRQTHTGTEIGKQTQAENIGPQTGTAEHPVKQKEPLTSNPISGANEIVFDLGEGHEQGPNLKPPRRRPQSPQQGVFPNLIPQSRPQSPWNSRRRIGAQRRINRPRLRPVTPTQPLPYPVNKRSQTMQPDSTIKQISVWLMLPTSTTPVNLLTTNDHINTVPNNLPLSTLSPHVSDTPVTSNPNSASPSWTPFLTSTETDLMTYSRYHKIAQTKESTLNSTSAPTLSNTVISETHAPDSYDRIFTHGLQTHTETQTALANKAERPTSKHSEELERNVSEESHFSTPHSSSVSSGPSATSTTTTAAEMTTTTSAAPKRASNVGKTKSTSTFITIQDILSTTSATISISPTTSTLTDIGIPTSSSARHISSATTSTTPTTTTSSTTSTFSPITSTTGTSTTRFIPIKYTSNATTELRTSTGSSTVSFIENPLTSNSFSSSLPTNTKSTTSSANTSAKNVLTTSTKFIYSTLSSTTTAMGPTSTKASTTDTSTLGQVDHRVRLVPGVPNQSGPPTDWKNPGANSIPDSHSSRSPRPPSSSLPAAPGAPVVRSRPRIADPHIRTVSFPAESMARLACEAQGEPKPSITWTKVATGAVMSIHSRVQRFEVLPNGTLVIQNVQLQDRGTYICSANSLLGRDRLLTLLEVWTRPPRMQLATYREVMIHQGGEVRLECQADGVPTPLLSWVLPDRSTLTSTGSSSSRIRMDINGTLHISVALPTDRGVYRCVASNSAGAASASVRIHVSSLPPVIQQPREEHLLLSPGRPLYIHCSARGAPPPTLRWKIPDGTLVRPSQFLHGNLYVLPNGTLHIRKVGPKDTGSYECTASNPVGTNVRTVRVVVEGGVETERKQGGTINERTKEVTSEKIYLSNKDRTLGIPFSPSDPSVSGNFSPQYPPDRSSSVLPKLSLSNSSSNFAPKIYETDTALPTDFTNIKRTNFPSLSSSSTLLTNNTKDSPSINNTTETSSFPADRKASAVLQPLPISPFTKARIVSTSPSTSTVHYGGTLQLHCSVTGNPMPTIIWRNPNKKLVDMHYSFERRLKVHPNGTLSVQAVTEKDAGDYLCIARNKVADDYRLLRVSVVTKPARIEPKQPLNHMVSFGKPLKVDCQASGSPHPVVRWSLPDGTMVNSVLYGEERVGRARRLTVFDNGTLLVPVAGMREEGEYICYAENQGGQDTMKVKVKVMVTSPPRFTHDRSRSVIKVHEGSTATIPCQATGEPVPTVTWFSPARRVIPQSLGSVLYSERVVVSSGGILQIRSAQGIDTGNYTCQATNSVGETSMVVSLEVEASTRGLGGQVGGRHWSTNENSRGQGIWTNNVRILGSAITGKQDNNSRSSNIYADSNSRIRNQVSNTSSNPALRSENGFNRHFSGGSTGISSGVSSQQSIASEADIAGIIRNGPSLISRSNSLGISHSTDRGDSGARNSGTNNNEVIAGRTGNDANSSRDNNRLSFNSRLFSNGAGTSIFRGNSFSKNSNLAGTSDSRRKSGGSSGNFDTDVGVVTTTKQQAVKGQTVLLPCPSQGFPPHRLAWLLPGNGMLPAPYYGSRLTVHRNGSLELRGVRESDGGTLVCVVRSERGETLIRVQLEVSEPQEESRSVQRGLGQERLHTGSLLSPAQPFRSESPFVQLQRGLSSSALPHPVKSPLPASPGFEPIVSTRTAPLVSTINGETLRLSCTTSQTQGSLSWTMPSGKVLSRGESGDSGRYVVRQDGTLIVERASVFDRGTYTCRSSSNDSSSVSVIAVPVIVIAYPPRITKGPSPVTYTHTGVAVELPCLTIATPRATVTWESPDLTQLMVMSQPRIYGNRYLSPQGSLVIQNPTIRDTGFYKCTAKNVIGEDSKATYLHVI